MNNELYNRFSYQENVRARESLEEINWRQRYNLLYPEALKSEIDDLKTLRKQYQKKEKRMGIPVKASLLAIVAGVGMLALSAVVPVLFVPGIISLFGGIATGTFTTFLKHVYASEPTKTLNSQINVAKEILSIKTHNRSKEVTRGMDFEKTSSKTESKEKKNEQFLNKGKTVPLTKLNNLHPQNETPKESSLTLSL